MLLVGTAILKLAIIVGVGYCLCRFRYRDDKILKFLSDFVVDFTMPALIFSTLVINADIVKENSPVFFLLLSVLFFACGLIIAFLVTIKMRHIYKREFFALVSFQNAGYLPMVLVSLLFPENLRVKFLVYIFLYILGYNILMWSIGSFLLFRKRADKFKVATLFMPPVIAVIVGLLAVYSGIYSKIPAIVIDPIKMIGETSFVLSMVVLGGWLSRVTLRDVMDDFPLSFGAAALKLVVLPLAFLVFLVTFKVSNILGLFLIMQAAMPSAVSLPIIAHRFGANSRFMAHSVFFSHILSIVTVSFWVSVYMKFSGMLF